MSRSRSRISGLAIATVVAMGACAAEPSDSGDSAPTIGSTDDSTASPTERAPFPTTDATGEMTNGPAVIEAEADPAVPIQLGDGLTVSATIAGPGVGAVAEAPDGFVLVAPGTEVATVAQSPDGIDWTVVESDFPATGASVLASDGTRVVASVVSSDDEPLILATEDAGLSWTALPPLPTVPADAEYVARNAWVTGLAVDGLRVVALAHEPLEVDWRAYSINELGQDHGNVTGLSSGVSTEVVVEFEDGYQLTVEPSGLGIPDEALWGSAEEMTAYAFDGSTWTRTELSLGSGSANNLVHGPAGFAAVLGQPATVLTVSEDGVTWTDHPLPPGLSQWPSLAGGTLGYAVADEAQVAFSPDGTRWEESHEFGDLDPNLTGPKVTAGGPAGFVFVDVPFEPGPPVRVLWSPDGIMWNETEFDLSGTAPVAAAVGAKTILLVPSELVFEPPPIGLDAADLVGALATSFVLEPSGLATFTPPVSDEDASCIATGLLDVLGEARVRELGLGAFPFHLLSAGLTAGFDASDAEAFVEVLSRCTASWKLFLILGVTSGTDLISEESARCIEGLLDDDTARDFFVLELDRPYDDPDSTVDMSHLIALASMFDECATEQELNALDWN